jgi:hypothetical protein
MCIKRMAVAGLLVTSPVFAQTTDDPFPDPIPTEEGVIRANVVEFAALPDIDGVPARMMLLVDEPGSGRLFVNDMRGPLYTVSYDGRSVARYIDINDPAWGVRVQSTGRERGFQSFAFHPQFNQPGTPGYGKFYTWTDTENTAPAADFVPGGGTATHHTVLLEWTASNPAAPTYDGGAPRELMRFEQPFGNHNAGYLGFNPLASPGDPDFGILYMGVADGGSGGDPLDLAQNLGSGFGKVFRFDPLGSNSANGEYGIPSDNPFVGRAGVLPEIYAYGVRNAQRFAWDPANGDMFLSDIGQNIIEKVTLVPRGANLGWNDWEGSFAYVSREGVSLANPRSDPSVTYPVVEWGQPDPLLLPNSAATGGIVYRGDAIPQLRNLLIFGDMPVGEIFYVSADDLPEGGQDSIRRILLVQGGGEARTLLQLIQAKNAQQGRTPAERSDMRFGTGPNGQIFLLNKGDGTIRLFVP